MFPSPPYSPRLKFSRICSQDIEDTESILDTFLFHSVHFLLPDSDGYDKVFQETLLSEDCIYFIVEDMTASFLIRSNFLSKYIRSGQLLAVTMDARIETENFLTVVPPGKLVLSLERSIAQSLALHKKSCYESSFIQSTKRKKKRSEPFQSIMIDLTSEELLLGKQHFKFIHSELEKIDYLKFKLLLKWNPKGDICVHSLKSYLISEDFKCTACKPNYRSSLRTFIPAPKIHFENVVDSDVLHDILEWFNLHICDLKYSSNEEEYVSKLTVPEYFEKIKTLHKYSFEGFFTKADILPVVKEFCSTFETNPSLPFIAVCISGFQDSFVQANGSHIFSSEDKMIYLIIFPSSKYWLITLNCR